MLKKEYLGQKTELLNITEEKKRGREENRVQNPWNIIKWQNIYNVRIPERIQEQNNFEKLFSEVIENVSNLDKDTDIQVQASTETQINMIREDLTMTYCAQNFKSERDDPTTCKRETPDHL